MEENTKPSYFSVIPAEVRYDNRLKANEKLLYAEITSLTSKNGICWASNGYFANLYNVDLATVSRWVSNLAKCGYIRVEIDRNGGNKRSIVLTKMSIGIDENIKTPIDENIKQNNINSNSKNNIKEHRNINISMKESEESIKNYPLDKFVIDEWGKIADKYKLPRIQRITDERRKRIAKVLKENDLTIERFFEILADKIRKSLFLQGLKQVRDGKAGWRFESADWQSNFDFYLERGKMLKVIEDCYTDKIWLKIESKEKEQE